MKHMYTLCACEKYITLAKRALQSATDRAKHKMWLVSVFFACGLIFPANPSRCLEPRKPHLTSCTIFYNCVNLPNGGYVWVPSRCTEGLVRSLTNSVNALAISDLQRF